MQNLRNSFSRLTATVPRALRLLTAWALLIQTISAGARLRSQRAFRREPFVAPIAHPAAAAPVRPCSDTTGSIMSSLSDHRRWLPGTSVLPASSSSPATTGPRIRADRRAVGTAYAAAGAGRLAVREYRSCALLASHLVGHARNEVYAGMPIDYHGRTPGQRVEMVPQHRPPADRIRRSADQYQSVPHDSNALVAGSPGISPHSPVVAGEGGWDG